MDSAATRQVEIALAAGMSCDEVSEDLGYDIVAVKSIAQAVASQKMHGSAAALMRSEANGDAGVSEAKAPLFNSAELELAKQTIVSLAAESEVDGIKLKAATFIINEVKGRNDAMVKALAQANGFDIVAINEALMRARAAISRTKEKLVNAKQEAIEV